MVEVGGVDESELYHKRTSVEIEIKSAGPREFGATTKWWRWGQSRRTKALSGMVA